MIRTLWITKPQPKLPPAAPPIDATLELDIRSSGVDHGLLVFNLTGLGPPKATVSGVGGPAFDGIRASFVRTDARHMVLTLAVTTREMGLETSKQLIYDYFPIKGEITFGITTDAKDVYVMAIVESVEMNSFAKVENAVISLFCPDPYFLSYLDDTLVFYNNEPDVWPFLRPIGAYNGDATVGVRMDILLGGLSTGTGKYLTITNTHETGVLSMTLDLDIVNDIIYPEVYEPGWLIHIDTRMNYKSVTLISGDRLTTYNIFSCVGAAEDWIELRSGNNSIYLTYNGPLHADCPDDAVMEYFPLDEEGEGISVGYPVGSILTPTGTGVMKSLSGVYSLYDSARFFDQAEETWLVQDTFTFFPGTFALSFWINLRTIQLDAPIITCDGPANQALKVRQNDVGGYLEIGLKYPTTWNWHNIGALATDTWYHIYLEFYNAGQEMKSRVNSGPLIGPSYLGVWIGPMAPLIIGGQSGTTGNWFDGQVQALMILNRLLTTTEQNYIYNNSPLYDNGRTWMEMTAVSNLQLKVLVQAKYQGV